MAMKIDPFLCFLHDLAEDIDIDAEYKTLVDRTDTLKPPFKKGAREKLKKEQPYALLRKLYETGHLTKNDPAALIHLLQGLDRKDLVEQVKVKFRTGFDEVEKPRNSRLK
ncbi:uncharacterized protein LOC144350700 [Saccoglossus kowalevskii]